jgi:hypothetical protein
MFIKSPLAGLAAGYAYKAVAYFAKKADGKKRSVLFFVAVFTASVVVPIVNTLTYAVGMLLLFEVMGSESFKIGVHLANNPAATGGTSYGSAVAVVFLFWIGINFFSEFGENRYLLDVIDVYNEFSASKIISKKKIPEYEYKYGLTEYLLQKYSSKETKSQYRELDNTGLINGLCDKIENKPLSVVEQCKFEKEYLEYVLYTNPKIDPTYYIVTTFKTFKDQTKPRVVLRRLCDGEEIKTRIKQSSIYRQNPFGAFSILKVDSFSEERKAKFIGGEWKASDEMEQILKNYDCVKE